MKNSVFDAVLKKKRRKSEYQIVGHDHSFPNFGAVCKLQYIIYNSLTQNCVHLISNFYQICNTL